MQSFLNEFYHNLLQTTLLEFVAVIFGLLSVWYVRKQNILGYPTGLVNVGCYVYICFANGLYANMFINAVYFLMSIYGWWNWTYGNTADDQIKVTKLTTKERTILLLLGIVLFFAVRLVLYYVPEGNAPFWDSLTTAIFLIAMWLQARKKLESWILWIMGDVIAVPLFALTGLLFTSFQYFIFLALATSGYFSWRKSYNQSQL
jgi:nicotinamide mononucleotide transporter